MGVCDYCYRYRYRLNDEDVDYDDDDDDDDDFAFTFTPRHYNRHFESFLAKDRKVDLIRLLKEVT